ncbi:MAG: hypothetical protein Q8S73_39270 [Deltaproteobacteria bacterium]|nr:hypothetical protein [Myxococcales bacterium]MDP3220207.1 hypothetical protein [Deltaproteobacteria bacterium]
MADDESGSTKGVRGVVGPLPGVNWDLTVAVTILMVLAAVAIPAFTRRFRRSKAAEATFNLVRIYQAEVEYFNRTRREGVGQFVSARATPASAPTATKYPADPLAWSRDPGWSALGFTIDQPHRYQYRVDATDRGFTVTAIGDVDGDGTFSTFSRSAALNAGEIQGGYIEITNELE